MRLAFVSILAVPAATLPLAALAHESVIAHAHPHEHVMDNALLGYEAMAVVAAAIAAGLVGLGIKLVLARRKK